MGIIAADMFVWWGVAFSGPVRAASADVASARIYFLDVGQGDSELLVFANGMKVLTDAGPDAKVVQSLAAVMPGDGVNMPYIDLAVISHAENDHFGGYAALLDHYRVGAFIYNGRDADKENTAWSDLRAKIKARGVPFITLGRGDIIHCGKDANGLGGGGTISVLAPDADFLQSAAMNDTGIVELVRAGGLRALLVADTGTNVEDAMLAEGIAVRADVLKVPHHGSKYASNEAFLRAVNPRVAVIEVGAKNSYGHPATSTLARIASTTSARIFRTDQRGTLEVWESNAAIHVVGEHGIMEER